MGLFDILFGRRRPPNGGRFQTLTAYQPTWTNWDGRIYASERIRACVDAKARHISKLSVEVQGSAKGKLKSKIAYRPNEFETWSQFLYRLATIYNVYNTAFIVPVVDEFDETAGFFAALPTACEVIEVQGEPWLRYRFANGNTAAIELSRCGVMKRHQCNDDIFGEDNALTEVMQTLDMQRQGTREGIKNSATFRFMARLDNFAKGTDIAKLRKQFNSENLQDESGGILLFPTNFHDVKQIESKPFLIDAEQVKIIDTRIYNYFGVNEDILQNKAVGDALDGFYEGEVETFAIQLSEVLTKMSKYSQREIVQGNRIIVTANRLQYMSTANKISLAQQLGDRGILKVDEIRELFNYAPLGGTAGARVPTRGEYYDVNEGKKPDGGNNDE